MGAFLDHIDFKPTKIIFIDDKESYLRSVQEELAKRNIEFEGFLYKGAEKNADELDLEVVTYQLERCASDNEFVTDIQASKHLKKSNIKRNDLVQAT